MKKLILNLGLIWLCAICQYAQSQYHSCALCNSSQVWMGIPSTCDFSLSADTCTASGTCNDINGNQVSVSNFQFQNCGIDSSGCGWANTYCVYNNNGVPTCCDQATRKKVIPSTPNHNQSSKSTSYPQSSSTVARVSPTINKPRFKPSSK